jgi:hypothetical protein
MAWRLGINSRVAEMSQPKSTWTYIKERSSVAKPVLWGAIILFFFIGILFFAYRVNSRLRQPEYEGKIINKWAGYSHTDEGSLPYFRILLETDDGERLTVAVDDKTYGRARIGMRIKKSSKGIELSIWRAFKSVGVT